MAFAASIQLIFRKMKTVLELIVIQTSLATNGTCIPMAAICCILNIFKLTAAVKERYEQKPEQKLLMCT